MKQFTEGKIITVLESKKEKEDGRKGGEKDRKGRKKDKLASHEVEIVHQAPGT